ncbi:MAG: DUF2085 domain-containing protein [Roseiflexaceae bacterium]|nr:DUF2085 domain-containing protein [Roseiflexaceae bacterium]
MTQHARRLPQLNTWPRWPLLTVLSVLFLGPIIAPLFQATQLWLVADSGALARDLLSSYICPTPAKSYVLAGYPMAVCARCWGATIGLWLAWFACRPTDRPLNSILAWFTALPWPLRLALAALPFLLWVAEIVWWPAAPLGFLLLNGALAGCTAGLFFCSIYPGHTRRAQ